jgi:hypothetical protein
MVSILEMKEMVEAEEDSFIFVYKQVIIENGKEQTYLRESERFSLDNWLDVLDSVEAEMAEETIILCMLDTATRRVMHFKEVPNRVDEIREI